MKFSEAWLRTWINPEISSEELVAQITMAGLEVDEVAAVAGEFSGVIVGEVVECGQHPDADKLRVTKVSVGGDELLDIVCGAPNCRQGLKVAVAIVGAVLPGDFKIKKAKLRGQPSHGMLCSYSELGISDDHDGIIELPVDAPVGMDIRDYLELDDVSIEVDLTPNRADCLGIKGLAREVGVLNNQAVHALEVAAVDPVIEDQKEIFLDAPDACPRYLGRVIKNVNLDAQAPTWMTERLRRSGIRSIDPVVDVTNYVLLELGHPMHAFDLDSLEGDIHVRLASKNEKLTLLDENEVELREDTLVIADEQKALAMAGIFGGLHSGVTDKTRDIFLESAFFSPLAILGKARQYGLHTDASHRYERGVDPELQMTAMERATQLLLDIVGGEAGPVVEAVADEFVPKARAVSLRQSRLTRLLGIDIEPAKVTQILERLGFAVTESQAGWEALVPPYRFDISIEEDLIEEVARVFGYNSIPDVAPQARLTMSEGSEKNLPLMLAKRTLIDAGFQEAITYSFVDPKKQQLLFEGVEGISLPHPISADMSVMRVSLWPGLLGAVAYNQKRQQTSVGLFESGLRFVPDRSQPAGIRQEAVISGVIAGRRTEEHWDGSDHNVDFFDIKGHVEALIALTGSEDEFSFERADIETLHPGQSAALMRRGELVGYLGAIHPQFEKKLGLNGRTFAFELVLEKLLQKRIAVAQPVSKFPSNRRDIAILVDESTAVADILRCIEKNGQNQLVGLNLFDVYRGQGVPDGKKSLAISLVLQNVERTLEESDIQGVVDSILNALSEQFAATLRD